MALEVIGAGWGRTGTESLKAALEELGFGTCYHMFELMKRTRQTKHWVALSRGETPDYDDLFRGFRSAVDFPAARHYRELAAQYPDAKVVLSVRDPAAWYASASNTILKGVPKPMRFIVGTVGRLSPNLRGAGPLFDFLDREIFGTFFEGRARDRQYIVDRFVAWNEEVKRTIPRERLLVFDVKEGWGPLCDFLGRPVPRIPFPKNNDSSAFGKRTSASNTLREFWRGAD